MSSGGSGHEPDQPWSSPSGGTGDGSTDPTQVGPGPVSPSGPSAPPPTSPYEQPYQQQPYQQPYQDPYQQAPEPGAPQYPGYAAPSDSPYGQPYGQYQPGGYPANPYAVGSPYGGVFSKPNGKANTAMGLGIASLVCAVLTPFCCITIPGVLTGPFAIGLAVSAKKEMDAQPGAFNNAGAATAGLITGIIGTVLGVIMIVLVVLFFGLAVNTP